MYKPYCSTLDFKKYKMTIINQLHCHLCDVQTKNLELFSWSFFHCHLPVRTQLLQKRWKQNYIKDRQTSPYSDMSAASLQISWSFTKRKTKISYLRATGFPIDAPWISSLKRFTRKLLVFSPMTKLIASMKLDLPTIKYKLYIMQFHEHDLVCLHK